MLIYFYYPFLKDIDFENHIPVSSLDHWILETYRFFKRYLPEREILIGDQIPDCGIIFLHSKYFPKSLRPGRNQYFVCFQVDVGRYEFAHYHIVHNHFQTDVLKFPNVATDRFFLFTNNAYIDPLPIKNIIYRVKSRGYEVKNISFHGNMINTPDEIHSDDFKKFLSEREMKLNLYLNSNEWNDFSVSDLSLCIRKFTSNPFYSKPYLKITNSLLADVPVIAGTDSSSKYFNSNYFNIPLVKNYTDLKKTIDLIKTNKLNIFNQLTCFDKYKSQFSESGIAKQWSKILLDIENRFTDWRNIGQLSRKLFFNSRKLITHLRK
jgi:hypothetical protein